MIKTNKKNQIIVSTLLSLVQDGICFLSSELEVLYQNPAMGTCPDLTLADVFTGMVQDAFTGAYGITCSAPVIVDGETVAVVGMDLVL